jgi:hypothetical protein
MTNDRDLWTDPKTSKLYNPRQILGPVPGTTSDQPFYNPEAWPEIRSRMSEKDFWPLYEGKHIDQFVVDVKPVERWVYLGAAEKKYGKPPDPGPKLVFRDIASNTNERTCIAAVLPEKSCVNNKLPVVESESVSPEIACVVLNSFAFDFLLRFRVSSTVNFTHISRVAVLPVADCRDLPVIETVSAAGTARSNTTNPTFEAVWQANWAVTQAYGLSSDDLVHILSTFPVFARKRLEFHAFLLNKFSLPGPA